MTQAPPRPPLGSKIKYDKAGNIVVGPLFQKWVAPLATVTVEPVDNAGAKKRIVTVVFSTPDGRTRRHRVKPTFADYTMSWVTAFNAWQKAVHPGQ